MFLSLICSTFMSQQVSVLSSVILIFTIIFLSLPSVFSSCLYFLFTHIPLFLKFSLHTSVLGRSLASQPTEKKNIQSCSAISLSTLTQKTSRWSGPMWKAFSQLFPASHDSWKNTLSWSPICVLIFTCVNTERYTVYDIEPWSSSGFPVVILQQQQWGFTLPTSISLTWQAKKRKKKEALSVHKTKLYIHTTSNTISKSEEVHSLPADEWPWQLRQCVDD